MEMTYKGGGQGRIVQGLVDQPQQQRTVVHVAQAGPQIVPQFRQNVPLAAPLHVPQICPPPVSRLPVQQQVQAVAHGPVQAQAIDSVETPFLQQNQFSVRYEEAPNTHVLEYTTYPAEGPYIQPLQVTPPQAIQQVHYQETPADPGTVQLVQQQPSNYPTQALSTQGI